MTRRVTEHVADGRRFRITDTPDGPTTVEAHGPRGWDMLDDDRAAAVLDRLRTGRPAADGPVDVVYTEPRPDPERGAWTSPPRRFDDRAAWTITAATEPTEDTL